MPVDGTSELRKLLQGVPTGRSRRSRTAVGRSPGLAGGPLPRVVGGVVETVTLSADLSSARRARLLVRRLCLEVELSGGLAQEAMVLTSEVVTNALRHAPGEPRVSVVVSSAGVYVEVGDDSRTVPALRPVDDTAGGGRGMAMLDAWADAWGVSVQGSGKVVWFELHAT